MTPGAPKVASLSCPNCGAPISMRSMGRAVSVVCDHCGSILDARDPQLRILQRFKTASACEWQLIPLGTRGKWRGTVYEVIGFQQRQTIVEGESYCWREYLLFNPYKGFRYLTEYNGHWNDVTVVTAVPEVVGNRVSYLGRTYKHFQTCVASTNFVLGEFPWQVAVHDSVRVTDYVSPPFLLSSETTAEETTWSLSEYVHGRDVWKAFSLQGEPPSPIGVFENQPSKSGVTAGQVWTTCLGLLAALAVIFMLNDALTQQAQVFQQSYVFSAASSGEASFVTPEFELKGRESSVQVRTDTEVANQWIYLNYALINEDTGQAYDFGREVSYYYGVDGGESWSEGSKHDSVTVPSIPPGKYYLRIEPESDANLGAITYTVTVVRDVPSMAIYLAALGALVLPAIFGSWRIHSFEQMRWAESDHPMGRNT